MINIKKCTGECGLEKELNKENFQWKNDSQKFNNKCKTCLKKYKKEYYQKNKNEILEIRQIYYQENKGEIYKYRKNRRKHDPILKLIGNISREVNRMLKGKKAGKSTRKMLPFTEEQIIEHMEKEFNKPGNEWMHWKNQGIYNKDKWKDDDSSTWFWNLDHIKPISHFNIKEPGDEEFRKCWDLTNLRPLSAKQNITNGNRR